MYRFLLVYLLVCHHSLRVITSLYFLCTSHPKIQESNISIFRLNLFGSDRYVNFDKSQFSLPLLLTRYTKCWKTIFEWQFLSRSYSYYLRMYDRRENYRLENPSIKYFVFNISLMDFEKYNINITIWPRNPFPFIIRSNVYFLDCFLYPNDKFTN